MEIFIFKQIEHRRREKFEDLNLMWVRAQLTSTLKTRVAINAFRRKKGASDAARPTVTRREGRTEAKLIRSRPTGDALPGGGKCVMRRQISTYARARSDLHPFVRMPNPRTQCGDSAGYKGQGAECMHQVIDPSHF